MPVFMIQVILGDGAQVNCVSWALLASGANPLPWTSRFALTV